MSLPRHWAGHTFSHMPLPVLDEGTRKLIKFEGHCFFKIYFMHSNTTLLYSGETKSQPDPTSLKLVTISYLIRRELFQGIFGHLQIRYELVVKFCIKLLTISLQTHTKTNFKSKFCD
jgi:hypothetical protein